MGQDFGSSLAGSSGYGFLTTAMRMSASAGASHLKASLEKEPFPSSFMWSWVRFSFLWAVGLRPPVSGWLLIRGLPHFLVTWASAYSSPPKGRWFFLSEQARKARERVELLLSKFRSSIPSLLPYCVCLKQFTMCSPHSGKDTTA